MGGRGGVDEDVDRDLGIPPAIICVCLSSWRTGWKWKSRGENLLLCRPGRPLAGQHVRAGRLSADTAGDRQKRPVLLGIGIWHP